MDTSAIVSSLSHISIDWLVIAASLVALTLAAVQGGAGRPTAVALAVPVASLLSAALPHAAILSAVATSLSAPPLQALLFVGLSVVAYILVRRLLPHHDETTFPLAFLAAVAATVVLLVTWIGTPALSALWSFGPALSHVFGAAYRFWWLLASLIALAFVRG